MDAEIVICNKLREVMADCLGYGAPLVTFTGTSSNGSTTITGCSSLTGVMLGAFISGPGIPYLDENVIVAMDDVAHTVELLNAAGVGAGAGTFTAYATIGVPANDQLIHLYKSGFSPSRSSTRAEFFAAECDYNGYAPGDLFASPLVRGIIDAAGNYAVEGRVVSFAATDGMVPNDCGGGWLDNNVDVGWFFSFDQPVIFDSAGSPKQLLVRLGYPAGSVAVLIEP
jgi:hypothetical protein